MHSLGTLRTFRTKHFTVIADAIEEQDVDLSWDEDGSVARQLDAGAFICFCARVRVFFEGQEVGTDYLGNCIYRSLDAFMDHRECGKQNRKWAKQGKDGRCGSYFKDMIHEAIRDARTTMKKTHGQYIR